MGQWEKSISEGTHNGRPVWFFSYSGQIEFAFYKSNLELAEIVDVHTGEEAVYDSKKDLMDTVNNPKDYYHNLYKGAKMDLLMYLRNPDAWNRKQAKVVEARRRAMIPEAKKYREAEAKRKQAQARAYLERVAKGKYAIQIKGYPKEFIYANTIQEARKKAIANNVAFIYDSGTEKFIGRIDRIGGQHYWTEIENMSQMKYTPVSKDGVLRNISAYDYLIVVGGQDAIYYAKSLNEARAFAINGTMKTDVDVADIRNNSNGKYVGRVVRSRTRWGFRFVWYTGDDKIPLNPDGTLKKRS